MTRKKLILGGAALLSAAVLVQTCFGEDAPPKPGSAANPPAVKGAKADEAAKPKSDAQDNQKVKATDEAANKAESELSKADQSDLEALFASAEAFVAAYNKGDAKAIANQFAQNAEYIDEQGYLYRGREAIEQAIAACLEEHKGAQIEMTILTVRMVAPNVAIEDGMTVLNSEKSISGPIETHYTATHVKADGKWQTVSVRETAPKGRREHKAQLQQLSWLMGDWVDEGEDTLVMSSCKPIQNGNFLMREFKLHVGGQEIMSGEQRIGWDPPTGKLKSWVFDSDGGYSEGYFQHDDDRWILKSVGVSTDGQPASCTTIYTLIDENTMTWQTVDHEVAGTKIPDSDVITVVRRAPSPEGERDKLTSQAN